MPQDVTKFAPLRAFADQVKSELANPSAGGPIREALTKWAALYRGFAHERFATFARGGGDWAPLKAGTIRRRRDVRKAAKSLRTAHKRLTKAKAAFWKARRIYRNKPTEARRTGLKKRDLQLQKAGATVRTRQERLASVKRRVGILWDTGTLIGALDPKISGAPGQLTEQIANGIRVGYGGPELEPERDDRTGALKAGKTTIALVAAYHQSGGPNLPRRQTIVPPDDQTRGLMSATMEKALGTLWKSTA